MAFQLTDLTLTYQGNCLDNVDENEVCNHYLLEDGGGQEDNAECALCSTDWGQSLLEGVEQTKDCYTTSYPCLTEKWLHCSSLV